MRAVSFRSEWADRLMHRQFAAGVALVNGVNSCATGFASANEGGVHIIR